MAFLVGLFDQLEMLVFLLAFKLAEKASFLWRCLVNLSIGCLLEKKWANKSKDNKKSLLEQPFHFGLKASFSATLKVIYQTHFLAIWPTNKPKANRKAKNQTPLSIFNIYKIKNGSSISMGLGIFLRSGSEPVKFKRIHIRRFQFFGTQTVKTNTDPQIWVGSNTLAIPKSLNLDLSFYWLV